MKTIKRIFVTRTKWVLLTSAAISVASLICYAAFAQTRHDDSPHNNKDAAVGVSSAAQIPDSLREPFDNESNADFVARRREWRERFFGLGPGVSTSAYAKALVDTRAMPLAPLVQTWSFQALSPMWNDWGGLGGNCTIPYPDPDHSYCGSSARIDAIAVHPTNADVVYTGSEGGLAKSTDGGLHWSYVSDNGIPSQSIRSLAVDPVASNIIYAGTGTNPRFGVGLYRSTNSGATWTIDLGVSQFSGKTVGKIAIDPKTAGSPTSTTLYASVTGGGSHSVWRSTNSGTSWTQIKPATPGAGGGVTDYDIVIQPPGPSCTTRIDASCVSTVYITAPDGVFKGSGNGTWTWIHDIPVSGASASLALAQSVLYLAFKAADGSTRIAKSSDGGSNWTELPQPCVPGFCADLYTFGVNPADPNQIFVGGYWIFLYSLNGGSTWEWAHEVHVDNHSIAFCPTNPQRIYLGTDGGIYRADRGDPICTDQPICWYSKNQNLPGSLMYGLSISSDDHIVQGNQDNGTQVGWAGRNPPWKRTNPATGDGFKPRIDQNNSNKFYYAQYGCSVSSDWGAPYRTTDGGTTSVAVTPPGAFGECSSFFPAMFVSLANSARVIMGFRNVWRSTDSGSSWTRIGGRSCPNPGPTPPDCFAPNGPCHADCGIEPSPTPGTATGVYEAPSDTNVIYAAFDASRLWVTSNAGQGNGATWSQRTGGWPAGAVRAVTVHPADPQTVYVACNSANSGLYKTTNMGVNWTQFGFANLGCWDVAIDPVNPLHVFAATGSGVYASTDGGTTWGLTLGIPAGMAVTSLSLNATSRHLAASTYGRGAYILDLGEVRQAESGVLTGCYIQADPNASGGYRVDGISSPGDNVAFTNFSQTTQLTIRYASPNTGTFGLYVNGTRVASIPITATGPYPVGWTIFTEKIVNVAIPANATVKFQYDTGDVGINLDYIIIAR